MLAPTPAGWRIGMAVPAQLPSRAGHHLQGYRGRIPGVDVAHFGAIEGIDRWRDVDVVVIIGLPLPRPEDIERMAAAVTGRPVIAGPMVQQHVTILAGRLARQIMARAKPHAFLRGSHCSTAVGANQRPTTRTRSAAEL